MVVNKSIIDIKEPEKRKSEYTLSIRIPASAKNRKIFSEIDNLNRSTINTSTTNFTPDFNPNLKAEAIILNNRIEQMRGYLQLTEIPVNDRDIEYEIIVLGKLANLFQDLGEKELVSLDLSAYDHIWNYTNLANSWDTYIIKNGSSFSNFDVSGNPDGQGYVYPLIDNGTSRNSQENEYDMERCMYPAIYVKQIVDSIFSEVGYRYESNFFNSVHFKRLIIPYTNGNFLMTESEVTDRTWIVSNATDKVYTTINNVFASDVKRYYFDTINQDTDPASVDTVNYLVDIASGNNGKYKFNAQGQIRVKNTSASTITNNLGVNLYLTRDRSGVLTNSFRTITFETNGLTPNSTITSQLNMEFDEFDLNVGDKIYIDFIWYGLIDPSDFQVDILENFTFSSIPTPVYAYGQSISLNSALPNEVKQTDFLRWIFRMFNLYVVSDKIDPKKLIIEPRDDFYTNQIVDLTPYLDVSKQITIKPMGVLDFRKLEMTYTQDDDEYNKRYQNVYREAYSTKKVEVNNDFLTQTQRVEIGFSPTPLGNSSNNDRILSKIRNEDPPTQGNELPSFNIRILYYGGLVSTTTKWKLFYDNGISSSLLDVFPYAGMLDSVSSPTFDLGWSMPKAIQYGNVSVNFTNGNLYNRYWKKSIEEITDKDSKLVTAFFKLSMNQFNNLDFRKFYLIDKQYYRIYNISHDLTSNNPVEIEFLKLKTAPSFTLTSGSGNGGTGGVVGDEGLPTFNNTDNSRYFADVDKSKLKLAGTTDSVVFLEYTNQIQFLDGASEAYLPDANLVQPNTGVVVITIKNINGSNVKIYSINENQTINGGANYTLTPHHVVQVVAYNGNYQIINLSNTGGS
jgi:hypothetical protein